jgi:hypothetical protein
MQNEASEAGAYTSLISSFNRGQDAFAAPRTITSGWWLIINLWTRSWSYFFRCRPVTFWDRRLMDPDCNTSSNCPHESNITNVVGGFPGPQQQAMTLGPVPSSRPATFRLCGYGATDALFHNCSPYSISTKHFALVVNKTRVSFSNEGRRQFENTSWSINFRCSSQSWVYPSSPPTRYILWE